MRLTFFQSTVKPTLTTTSKQQQPVINGQFDSPTISLNLAFIRPLFQTATFFRSQMAVVVDRYTLVKTRPSVLSLASLILANLNWLIVKS
jgi:hypothetical protein